MIILFLDFNLILDIDLYKLSYFLQYLFGIIWLFLYLELCGGCYLVMCFFGLQYILSCYLICWVMMEMVEEVCVVIEVYGELFFYEGWW